MNEKVHVVNHPLVAHKLTILRVVMIPAFLLVLYLDVPWANYWALAIFAAASITDTLDGYIARHYNQITDFGKFMDPLADKVLVMTAMVCFCAVGRFPAWALVIVIFREFAVSGLRLIAVEGGRTLSGGEYTVMGDRIVAATLLSAAAAAGGRVRLGGVDWRHLATVLSVFHQAGCRVESKLEYVELERDRDMPLKGVPTIRTAPYPGFPTDAQAILMAALAGGEGATLFVENIFDSRYRHVDELRRMGADTVEVRKLFASTMEAYRNKAQLVASAQEYRGCAIAYTQREQQDMRIIASQAADEHQKQQGPQVQCRQRDGVCTALETEPAYLASLVLWADPT